MRWGISWLSISLSIIGLMAIEREPQQALEGCFVAGKVMLGQSLVQNSGTRRGAKAGRRMLRCRMGVPLPLLIPMLPRCHTVPS